LRSPLSDGPGISSAIYVLVNGRNIVHLMGVDTVLKEGDVISILPVTAGG